MTPPMKRILLIVPTATRGTIPLCSYNLFRALKTLPGAEVRVFLLHPKDSPAFDYGNALFEPEQEMRGISRVLPQFIKSILALRRIKKNWKPDACIGTLNACSAYNILSGGNEKKLGIFHGAFSWSIMQDKSLISFCKYLWGRICYRFLFHKLDYKIAVSTHVMELAKQYISCNDDSVHVIYNVHNVAEVRRKAELPFPEADSFLTARCPQILFVGTLTANKGVVRLIKAFSEVKRYSPDCRLTFIGADYGELEKAHALVKKRGLENDVKFMGYLENPYPYMKRANILVSASYSEGLPGVLIEAGILGTPLVATNSSSGVWEILNEYPNYDENLQGVFETPYGIITQNHSPISEESVLEHMSADEHYLAEAILKILHRPPEARKINPFSEKVKPELIAFQFEQLIQA